VRLLEGIVSHARVRLAEIPLLSASERHQLLAECNDTTSLCPRERCIHELFAEVVASRSDGAAVVADGGALSYGELAQRAERLAVGLRGRGVGPETAVGLALERSPELLVATLAALQAGGCYLPLDPGYPAGRLAFMIEDAGAAVVLAKRELIAALPPGPVAMVPLDEAVAAAGSGGPLVSVTWPESLAYVIYTSGSTGMPKGVAVTHLGVVRLVRGTSYAAFGPGETVLQFAATSFDAATFEIWGALLNGGRLALMPPGATSLYELGRAVAQYRVTTLWLTAGLFHQMAGGPLDSLDGVRQLLAGGDVLSPAQVARVRERLPDLDLIDGYGPTENTTFTCCHPVRQGPAAGESVPIGRPINGTLVRVLGRRSESLPLGVPGELHAGGDGLARGYLGRPALTADRFVPDPLSDGWGGRLYRTGDRVRWLAGGVLEFLGRADDQVKARGFRIEPGEVEAALASLPEVAQAAVVVRRGEDGERRLVGYAAPRDATAGTELGAVLRRALAAVLPDFMVPAAVVVLKELPLDPNGKVDRRALPEPEITPQAEFEAPQTATERILARIWGEVLGSERIGRHDHFFDLGGHSLLATRVITRLGEGDRDETTLASDLRSAHHRSLR
jgi:amino acid adenylation domain-containing protein